MSKWSRDMACAVRLSWRRWVQHAEHAVFCHLVWWETGATSLPRELPKWSRLTTISQGISWLNCPTHTHPHTRTHAILNCLNLTGSYITEAGPWAQIKDSDHCFAILAEPTKGKTRSLNRKGLVLCSEIVSLRWQHFKACEIFMGTINTVKSLFSYLIFWHNRTVSTDLICSSTDDSLKLCFHRVVRFGLDLTHLVWCCQKLWMLPGTFLGIN